jgi:hypothetical protein
MRPGDLEPFKDVLPFAPRRAPVNLYHPRQPDGSDYGTPVLLPPEVRQYLMRELAESGQFVVAERERVLELIRELEFVETRYVDPGTPPKTGRIVGVHYIIEAAFLPPESGGTASANAEGDKHSLPGSPPRNTGAQSSVYLDVYDVETGQVACVCFGSDLNPAIAARKAVDDLLDRLRGAAPPIKVSAVTAQGDVQLDIGSADRVHEGDVFTLKENRPPSSNGLGRASQPTTIEIWRVDPLSCLGRVLGAGKPAKVGDRVVRMEAGPKRSSDPAKNGADQADPGG